ncbi:hypothetical protein K504DRAFT_421141 [Pleomassaria siparia CBS 279.74]|uniref:Uncharacterized protein n=1 Tax=Pleomassaria siparia CBS 279.74 TaxID=1314801 RepID=A0A6G1KQL2_9PLEO|nr:hypothetical protein K504DRAFT_421141 [Pleomassaria siparia CBS 279.74]
MSGKEEYVDVTRQGDGGFAHDVKPSPSMGKEQEARMDGVQEVEGSSPPPPPPSYTTTATSSAAQPPEYRSLNDVVEEDVHSLLIGDPNESILVPMIHTREKQTFKTVFLGKNAKTSYTVIARKMPRSHYLKFYAKDSRGNYIGTEKAAVDAGLVFVPSKSNPEDLLQQVRQVAFGKPHYGDDFGSTLGMAGAGAAGGGGF